jgi:hypothetical protein
MRILTIQANQLLVCLPAQVLDLGSNQISNVATLALSVLTNLRSLNLSGNDISKLEGLEGLFKLQELVLDRNRIRYGRTHAAAVY